MCRIAMLIGGLQLTSMVSTIWTSTQLETWTASSNQWLSCTSENYRFRDWDAYGFYEGEEICSASRTGYTMFDCTSACVYNTTFDAAVWDQDITDAKCSVTPFEGKNPITDLAQVFEYGPCDCGWYVFSRPARKPNL
jgi:hypothetical protein